jgi:hypothetical protein
MITKATKTGLGRGEIYQNNSPEPEEGEGMKGTGDMKLDQGRGDGGWLDTGGSRKNNERFGWQYVVVGA